jgi:hypothetical protein
VGAAWATALSADTPFILDMVKDPDVRRCP